MFQHWSGTMCLGDQRFTQMHLSHSELCVRHPSLDTCTVPCGLLSHIGMLRSLGQTEPQIGETEKTERERGGSQTETQTEGLRRRLKRYEGVKARSCLLWGSVFASG